MGSEDFPPAGMQGTITRRVDGGWVEGGGGGMVMFVCAPVIPQTHLCHSGLSEQHFLSNLTVTESRSRYSEVISYFKRGEGGIIMRNVKRDGLW